VFGALLQQHRSRAGLSQEELAEQAGLSRRGISDLERGLRLAPYLATIRRLADALGLHEPERAVFLATSRGAGPVADSSQPSVGALNPPVLAADSGAHYVPAAQNLPRLLTSFVGRETALLELERLQVSCPLLTLAGPGGMGKTRLSVRLAQRVITQYAEGAWFVDLSGVTAPGLIGPVVAAGLGVVEQASRSTADSVAEYLSAKHALLVLDNCEHQVAACAEFVERLLHLCPTLHIVATSREPLRIPGETVWRVPPLTVPEAMQLFVARAEGSVPGFVPSERMLPSLVRICDAVDGLPLALELAVSRLPLFGVDDLADRLDDRLRILTRGSRTGPARHQTIRATLDWSYQLLSESERSLFRRLSVFAGGWTIGAAEGLGVEDNVSTGDVLDVLQQLIDCSLVQAEPAADGSMRYRLLEMVRDYGYEQLRAAGSREEGAARQRHAAYFSEFAERGQTELLGPRQAAWLEQLEREHDNLRAALDWAVRAGSDPELGLHLGAALARFWFIRGHLSEGSRWLDAVCALPVAATSDNLAARATALNGLANLATLRGNFVTARELLIKSLHLRRTLGDRSGAARTLLNLGNIEVSGCNYDEAERLFTESLGLRRELGDTRGIARALNNLAVLARERGQAERMAALANEAFELSQRAGDLEGIALALISQGIAAWLQRQPAEAAALFRHSLSISAKLGHRREVVESIELLAGQECALGRPERAARLFGAAEAILEDSGLVPLPSDRFEYARNLAAVRASLDTDTLAKAWAEGRGLAFDQAVCDALGTTEYTPTCAPRQ
jgi:predicted ATPase/transcriptional regulator with XRE-family HTH domain